MPKTFQAKHLADAEIVAAVRATRGRHGVERWATTWDVLEHLSKYPPKVVMTRLQSAIRRGVIDGHACSKSYPYCRGDFELPDCRECGEADHLCQCWN